MIRTVREGKNSLETFLNKSAILSFVSSFYILYVVQGMCKERDNILFKYIRQIISPDDANGKMNLAD